MHVATDGLTPRFGVAEFGSSATAIVSPVMNVLHLRTAFIFAIFWLSVLLAADITTEWLSASNCRYFGPRVSGLTSVLLERRRAISSDDIPATKAARIPLTSTRAASFKHAPRCFCSINLVGLEVRSPVRGSPLEKVSTTSSGVAAGHASPLTNCRERYEAGPDWLDQNSP